MDPWPLPETIPQLLEQRAARTPDRPACFRREGPGRWTARTWSEWHRDVEQLAHAFCNLGLRPGEALAIVAPTCPEWQLAELAALRLGAVVVGVEPHAPVDQIQHILRHAQARALIVSDASRAASLSAELRAELHWVVCVRGEPAPGIHGWTGLLDAAVQKPAALPWPRPSDPATLIYTSGTTGRPKAIRFEHRHLLAACYAIIHAFPQLGSGDSVLSWLPMAHLFQRMINLVAIERGATVYFVEDPRQVMDCLREVEPSVLVAVPRFYERVYEGIETLVAAVPRVLRALVRRALATGNQYARALRQRGSCRWPLRLRFALADRLVLSRIRAVFGRRVRFLLTGSAPTPAWLLEYFHALGLLILEAYGVSENAVPMATNRPSAYRFGSVGRPLEENEIRLADDGEILVRGPGVFSGYFREEEPRELFTPDGFYRTGDLGRLDPDGFLYLTGRKAEIIKTSTGRRISPARIEAVYAQSPLIDAIVVVGNGRKYLVGLVVPNLACARRRLPLATDVPPEQVLSSLELHTLLAAEIETLGQQLAPHERIVRFAILTEPFSLLRGEVTPTLKVRRDRIAANYATLIEQLYDSESSPAPEPCPASSSPAPPA